MVDNDKSFQTIDVIIVGAGFSGLFMLYRLRQLGFTARILEAADGIGGTWYCNGYPGARCDIESFQYSYSFSDELRAEWHWTERYASQPEILRYINYVADKFDLRSDIQLNTRVTSAVLDESVSRWTIDTDGHDRISAKFCIMATGCLSTPKLPDIKGLDTFKGNQYHSGQWPHEPVNFSGRRVAVIGTGSTGIQIIPIIAKEAAHLYVFQRTPSFSVPAYNGPLSTKDEESWNVNYEEHRRKMLDTYFACEAVGVVHDQSAMKMTAEERQQVYEARWQIGGLTFLYAFNDIIVNKEANNTAAEFVRSKIRQTVQDSSTAESLLPHDYALGTKRLCVNTDYFETYNHDHVTLIDLRKDNIEEITPHGLKTTNAMYEVDSIVFATGFDAMTGALHNINVQGRSSHTLQEKWSQGPRTYLGLMTAGFPNLFLITGPGSPSVLTNMIPSIEQHVEWIAACIDYLRKHDLDSIEPTVLAEDAWVNHVNDIANMTLFPTANSWYAGANIPGKCRVFMPYAGGFPLYHQKCKDVEASAYDGFRLTKRPAVTTD